MSRATHKFFSALTAVLVGLALNLCVCAGAGRAGAAPEPAAASSDPHACCHESAEDASSKPSPVRPDPCESCPVKQKLGGALPDQLSKLTHSIDAMVVQWPVTALVSADDRLAAQPVFDHHHPPPLLLDLFHSSCQLSC
jgi:hypothetical protein